MDKDNNDSYANSRRLTRKQASMVTSNQNSSNATAEEASAPEVPPPADNFNPVDELLDRQSFQGEPDPEENEVYEVSTSSNSTSSFPIPAKRNTRFLSMASDLSSLPASTSQSETPAESLGVDTRSSVASAQSESATTPKKSRKTHIAEPDGTMGAKRTRRRTDSLSSDTSDL